MSDRRPSLPPLPAALERGARKLRDAGPSPDFEGRLSRALARADVETPRRAPLWSGLAIVVPTLTAVVLVLHTMFGNPTESLSRYEEHDVVLGEDGQAWVDLDLWTHHHEHPATVHIDAPASMDVEIPAGAESPAADCDRDRCQHQFVTDGPPGHSSVRVRVRAPGRHAITIEHTSPSHHVRGHFLVHAR
jgi:hypothetical protein